MQMCWDCAKVENYFVLDELNRAYVDRDYKIIHYDSPDSRGIDNALLYDPSVFEVITSKPIQTNYLQVNSRGIYYMLKVNTKNIPSTFM